MKTKIITFLMVMCLIAGHIPATVAYAAEDTGIPSGTKSVTEPVATDDGMALRIEGQNTEDFYGMSSRSVSVTHNEKFKDYKVMHGIDISHHNNYAKDGLWHDINWYKVKADGIDFVMLRTAYRGYGPEGNIKPDDQFEKNIKKATEAGLEIGVYFFSQAITVAEAQEEAAYILKQIKGYKIDLPVVIDYEYTAGEDGRLYAAKLTDRQRTDICKAFCQKVEASGYQAMVYANRSMLTNDLYSKELIAAGYDVWLAEWSTKAAYKGDYSYWQYTSDGQVNGVPSARVDMNYRYALPSVEITGRSDTAIAIKWGKKSGADGYYIYRKTGKGSPKKIAQVKGASVTKYTDTGLQPKTPYTYKVTCYKIGEDGKAIEYSSDFNEASIYTTVKFAPVKMVGGAADIDTIKVKWNAVEHAYAYQLQCYNSKTGGYSNLKYVSAGEALAFTHTGLKMGGVYAYRVRPYTYIGGQVVCGSWSPVIKVQTSTQLKTPTLTPKQYSYTTNKMSWGKIKGAAGYQVQRYNPTTKKYVTLKTIKGGSTCSFSNTYLNANTTYTYRVRAYATVGGKTIYSAFSSPKSVKTKGNRIGKVTTKTLNVRAGAGTKYKKLRTIAKNKNVIVTGSTAKWYRVYVVVNGKYRTGYVSKSYLKLQ